VSLDLNNHPHRRFNPLLEEWVLCSPHRTQRPWSGQIEEDVLEERPAYDPGCYLCPGNQRAGSERNPEFTSTYVFDNDFAALRPDRPAGEMNLHGEGLLRLSGEPGLCRVVVCSPRHNVTLADMEREDIIAVVAAWSRECRELGGREEINHVQVFENKGAMMGCSNPHPHSQIWAGRTIPSIPEKELAEQMRYFKSNNSTLLGDYAALEERLGERVVYQNDHFIAVVPFWAVWPYELLILPRQHVSYLTELDEAQSGGLADMLRQCAVLLNRLFRTDCPYSMCIHQAPFDGSEHPACGLHLHYYPPLLRNAKVRKFLVGYEMAAEPQRDLTPELAAQKLRDGVL
jgi:UDPglucose--hexose-1-phosphate uridylyltransferase